MNLFIRRSLTPQPIINQKTEKSPNQLKRVSFQLDQKTSHGQSNVLRPVASRVKPNETKGRNNDSQEFDLGITLPDTSASIKKIQRNSLTLAWKIEDFVMDTNTLVKTGQAYSYLRARHKDSKQ